MKFTGVLNSLCGAEEMRLKKVWDNATAEMEQELLKNFLQMEEQN